jgi:hypothetical protein
MNGEPGRVERVALGLIAVGMLPAGLQAAFLPRDFFDDFPLGRGWVAADGAYNEHLTRDVGGLFLALIVVTVFALWRRSLVVPVAIAWLVQGTIHFVYHAAHLDLLDGADAVGLAGSLVFVPVLALVALGAVARDARGRQGSSV